jgi:hypothetical protein
LMSSLYTRAINASDLSTRGHCFHAINSLCTLGSTCCTWHHYNQRVIQHWFTDWSSEQVSRMAIHVTAPLHVTHATCLILSSINHPKYLSKSTNCRAVNIYVYKLKYYFLPVLYGCEGWSMLKEELWLFWTTVLKNTYPWGITHFGNLEPRATKLLTVLMNTYCVKKLLIHIKAV